MGLACGTLAKTDRNDACDIASFMRFWSDAGGNSRASRFANFGPMTRSNSNWSKQERDRERERSPQEAGSGGAFDDLTRERSELHARQNAGIVERIRRNVGSDAKLRRMGSP